MLFLLRVLLAVIALPAALPAQRPTKPISPASIRRMNGIPTLQVDGKPFLILGAQCDIWRSTRQDEKTIAFFDGYRAMNATTVSVGVPWSKLEPEQDVYDFQFMDWFIRQARARNLRLVINLFNTNVCGKVFEGSRDAMYPCYVPSYILNAPDKYRRMMLPYPYTYVPGGPPMCPNDPNTLERERRLVVRVAEHLKRTDTARTVIMVQLDNEFYYQQWEGKRPDWGSDEERAIRCQCPNCLKRWGEGKYASGEEFMFRSFADYVRVLSDAFTAVYPLPLYLNSPWWPTRVVPIFLDRCPNLTLVGMDGVLTPREPNELSRSQLGRNIPFAAENPTENSEVRLNLDVLPYYTILGRQGLGNLLWECGPPHTVVEDSEARRRYGAALLPLKSALVPIANARGTSRLLGWYALRDVRPGLTTDIFGNFVAAKDTSPAQRERRYVREGVSERIVDETEFEAQIDGLKVRISDSAAGVVVRTGTTELVLAIPHGRVWIEGVRGVRAERGRFDGAAWKAEGSVPMAQEGNGVAVEITAPGVVRLTFREARPSQ